MNKKQREQAATEVYLHISTGDRCTIKLSCGMTVRCANTPEAKDAVVSKLLKPLNFNSVTKPRLATKRAYNTTMREFIADNELENAEKYAALHNKVFIRSQWGLAP